MRNTHGARLERWLGLETVEILSRQTMGWHGAPIPVGNVPGLVYACGDGDFVGAIKGGHYAGLADYAADKLRSKARRVALRSRATCHAGFSSLGDIISEATSGAKRQDFYFYKGPTTGAATNQDLYPIGDLPPVGTGPAAIPGGTIPTRTTGGSLLQQNAAAGDTLHLVSASLSANTNGQTLLLYDRTFHAASILHTTTGNQAVSGVPTRYTTTDANGVFITLAVNSTLGTTAHTATITYTDQDGNAAEAGTAQAVTVSSVAARLPLPQWFYRLNDGDTGARTVTNVAFSAVSSGQSRIIQGKALLYMPHPNNPNGGANYFLYDGINAVPGLPRILDDACLTFMALQSSVNAATFQGQLVMVSG